MAVDLLPAQMAKQKCRTNWATNIVYTADALHEVSSVEQIQSLLQSDQKLFKVVATSHAFTSIADSPFNHLSLRLMHQVIALDAEARTVTVEGGITYSQLCPYLHHHGFALSNLASIAELSIAGACSTAVHGSGGKNSTLAASISALEMVTAEGDLVQLSRHTDGDAFCGVVVGLGALGVITRITLDIQPDFTIRQYVYHDLPMTQLQDHFDSIISSGYSVSLFTDWQEQRVTQVWIKIRDGDEQMLELPPPDTYFGARLAMQNVSILPGLPIENFTEQMGVPGSSYERLPHFNVGVLGSAGEELQSEYFVHRRHAVEAIMAIEKLRDEISPHLKISEIRTIAADDLWMSMCYQRESVAIHFTWKRNWAAVKRLLPMIERALFPYDPRPHWGKLFTMSPALLQSKYERLDDFRKLVAKYDPHGKFRNDCLNTNIFTTGHSPELTDL